MLTRADACGGGPASMSSVRSCPVRSPQLGDGLVEVVDGTERLVHAGEAQVGDLVELAQRTQDGEPDLVAGHLSGTGRPDRLFDGLRQLSQHVLVDRPALASPAHAVDDLQPAERLGDPAALDHRERGLLDGREPTPAVLAAATAADDLAFVVLARIDDPRIGMSAVRTPHSVSPPLSHPGPIDAGASTSAWGQVVDPLLTTARVLWTAIPKLWMTYTSVTTRCRGRP